ncbi:carboxypeptidase B-like [Macrobrachium nipponense]|uniref:carboxypeptidase B-like n=1 Tax=Macrobrachium nipponense TaxID=159736 RepID=UPI0030C8035F
MDTAAKAMAAQIKKTTLAVYSVGNSAVVYYPAAGASDDWAANAMDIAHSYTIELRDKGVFGFKLPASQILPTVRDAWEAVKTLATLV